MAGVFREFDRMHRDLHAWQPGELMALNEAIARGEKDIATTAEIAGLIEEATRLSERSAGLFNPAIGKLVALWSFHRDQPGGRSRTRRKSPASWRRIRGWRTSLCAGNGDAAPTPRSGSISAATRRAMRSIAPPRSLGRRHRQRARRRRRQHFRAGQHGDTPWRIGLEDPRAAPEQDASCSARSSSADGEAIGTSGDYRRYYIVGGKRYAHIIDPRSGYPATGVRSVTVVVPPRPGAGALSDAASKPLFIAGPSGWREAADNLGITQALLVDDEGRLQVTPELAQRLRGRDVEARKERGHVR